MNPESIDVAAHLKGMREMLNGSLGGHIQVEMNFDTEVWPIEIDAGELELAILNLCLNARDAMPDGGAVTITAENVQVDDERGSQADYVKLSMTDTGCGMPPEVLARAFEPFFTTKDVGKGSGLGLPQVYGFANQSGGQVTIDSEVGVGTIVTLLLPRSLRQPVAGARAADPSSCTDAAGRRDTPGARAARRGRQGSVGAHARDVEQPRVRRHSRHGSRSGARRTGQRARHRRRPVRHHDARRRQRPRARPGNQDDAIRTCRSSSPPATSKRRPA